MLDIITLIMVAISLLLFGYRPPWCTKKFIDFKFKEVHDIPGPPALPILGTSWLFLVGRYQISKLHEYYKEMRDKYGPIVKEEALFNVPVLSVYSKADLEKVFKSTGKYPMRPPTEAIAKYRRDHPERYASGGLINEQGEKWHYLRTSLTTALTSPKTIQNFLPEVEAIADDWCHLLETKRDPNGRISNLEELAGKLGLEVTCTLVLGRRMGFLIDDQVCPTAQKLSDTVKSNFAACRDTYFGLPFWRWVPTKSYKRLCDSEKAIYELASELIRTADESTRESAVFQSVLKANIDEREKKSAIVDFLAAGIHTLKNSLLFLLYQVALSPESQEKIITDDTNTFSKACSMETFRISPTAHCVARITECDLELSGYHVPAGSVVLCQTALACKNDDYFKEAKKFRPERWLDDEKNETAANATYLVTPFGYGRRICPGKRYIEQILPIFLEKVVKKFKIHVDEPMEEEFEFLLSPKGNVSMYFNNRL
ncbi:ecdysone 20-monooxygenase [Sitophilus oryzae]|uniref:Ecdysone 20-monooxygenase n=1 Tax=Sitophilus oryzae TaxID=7048 RepID=A0A6J2XNA0_SITOR|nr:ecdysone 20-monooxygenase [Sitophilus oryzae]XP_030752135.1 ecdysone 20-monooxygenase [Sitophilus oryzae]XP_030752136.1 ecdysone 20-monooxygenase [Sitophilus oryzae]